jgi:hypothetical protein
MPQRPLIGIIRAAVVEIAPERLSDVDSAVRAHGQAPAGGWRAGPAAPPTISSGADPALAALALAVAVDLAGNSMLHGARRAGRLATLWARLRGRDRIDLDVPPPAVQEFDAARLEAAGTLAARERGASDEIAVAVGAALARNWPRHP